MEQYNYIRTLIICDSCGNFWGDVDIGYVHINVLVKSCCGIMSEINFIVRTSKCRLQRSDRRHFLDSFRDKRSCFLQQSYIERNL